MVVWTVWEPPEGSRDSESIWIAHRAAGAQTTAANTSDYALCLVRNFPQLARLQRNKKSFQEGVQISQDVANGYQ